MTISALSRIFLISGTVAETTVINGRISFLSAVITLGLGVGPALKNGSTSMINGSCAFCCKTADTNLMDSIENNAPMSTSVKSQLFLFCNNIC